MSEASDMLALCVPGAVLRTRDRSEAVIERVDAEAGLIHGEVRMHGPCVWRRDGIWRDAPFGAPGPLDLVPPAGAEAGRPQRRGSVKDALGPENRAFCCD